MKNTKIQTPKSDFSRHEDKQKRIQESLDKGKEIYLGGKPDDKKK